MKKRILSLMLSAALITTMPSAVMAAVETYSDGEVHTIGVAVYDPDSAEMKMFSDYYRDYIQGRISCEIYFFRKTFRCRGRDGFCEAGKRAGSRGHYFLCR